MGNRLAETTGLGGVTFVYDAAHQLVSAVSVDGGLPGLWSFGYDDAGRLTQTSGPGATRDIAYDARGLPATLTTERDGAGTWESTRTYDGDGTLRGSSTVDPAAVRTDSAFTWDLVAAVPEIVTHSTDGADTHLLYGEGRIAAVRAGLADAFSYDAHGSALARGPAGDLAVAEAYDPFGRPGGAPIDLGLLGLSTNPVGDHSPRYGYRGELHHDGLVHLRARDHDPGVGRFSTHDPLEGVPGELTVANPYHYANNDPLNLVDPLGLRPVTDDVQFQALRAIYELGLLSEATGIGWAATWQMDARGHFDDLATVPILVPVRHTRHDSPEGGGRPRRQEREPDALTPGSKRARHDSRVQWVRCSARSILAVGGPLR